MGGFRWRTGVLLVAAYWRTNLTLRQLAPLFGASKSAAGRIVRHVGPLLAFPPRKRFHKYAVLIVDGTLVPTRDHAVAERSKNYRYSTNHQVVIDADTRLVVVVGRPATAGQPQRLQGMGAIRGQGRRRERRSDRRRRLPRYRARHPTPPRPWTERTARLEARAQRLSPHGPRSGRACFRPDEDLEDPARLPPQWHGVHHAMLGIAHLHNLARRD